MSPGAGSKEIQVLLKSCCLDPDESTLSDIKCLLKQGVDWNALIEMAVWHQVSPLLRRTLLSFADENVPPVISIALRVNYEGWQEHTDNLWAEQMKILTLFSDNAVSCLPIKGPIIGKKIYGDMALRPFGDLDFLIKPSDVDVVLEVLATLDYKLDDGLSQAQAVAFRKCANQYRIPRKDARVWIEPHWQLPQQVFAVDFDIERMWQRSRMQEVDGIGVRRADPIDELLILCIHGFTERWRNLKWVCDVAEFIRAHPDLDWEQLYSEARAAGCLRILRLGLCLSRDLLDAPVSECAKLDEDRVLDHLVKDATTLMFETKAGHVTLWTPNWFHFRSRERWSDRARYVMRSLFATRPAVIGWVDFPPWLSWAYAPLRQVHDYILLPVWQLVKAVRSALPGS